MADRSAGDYEAVIRRVKRSGNGHVLAWLDELDDRGRTALLDQLAKVDFDRVEALRTLIEAPPTDIEFADMVPAPVERLPIRPEEMADEREVFALGERALRANRVAAVTVAGGQGTRLRYDHPKGMYPISPIRGKSLFQLFAEQILAARRRYGCDLPWLIMTSLVNDAETRAFFRDSGYFGMGADSVRFFSQGTNPILGPQGELLLAEKGELLVGPDGHGGTLAALEAADLLTELRSGGYDLITYFQVDNPLVTAVDPRFIGHHLRLNAEFSCKVIPKRDPREGLGIAVLQEDKPAVIEYVDVPEETASERFPDGKLRFRFGSIAIHIINVSFIDRVISHDDHLPWHVALKQYETVNEAGTKVLSAPKSCHKFERFIFDALRFADAAAFVEVARETEFGPVKNYEGQDSPESARRLMQQCWLRWLRQADADFEMPADLSSPVIEISPLYADSAEELKRRIEPGWEPQFPLVLEE
jgi:UDP-N-acetylglucosamine/UDP-N-acetylgalactosamine diphosphorylase